MMYLSASCAVSKIKHNFTDSRCIDAEFSGQKQKSLSQDIHIHLRKNIWSMWDFTDIITKVLDNIPVCLFERSHDRDVTTVPYHSFAL